MRPRHLIAFNVLEDNRRGAKENKYASLINLERQVVKGLKVRFQEQT